MTFLKALKAVVKKYNDTALIARIVVGIIVGICLALLVPDTTWIKTFGDLFVSALKAIAPLLVFVLVTSALSAKSSRLDKRFGTVLALYMASTFMAAVVAVTNSFLFPVNIALAETAGTDAVPPQGIGEVLRNLLMNIVSNPLTALTTANYIGILFWAVLFGLAMKKFASDSTVEFLANTSEGVSQIVKWIINLAPFGICGLVFNSVSTSGIGVFTTYGKLLLVLVGSMLAVALIVDPLIAAIALKRNPYPLVFRCLRESGITAFFTRSSAANIPVNMELCEKLSLDKDMYSVAIPLGATINMDGAAITITIMTLATAHTIGVAVDIPTAIILSVLATIAACGASGVAGGSLLLIPMACSLFGIGNDIAMQVVGVGFIIGVVQDSVETMINSAGDVMFAATAEYREWLREGKNLPAFMYSKKEREKLGLK